MAKETQSGRLRGPGAAGGAGPGTTNTTAAETAENAVVAEGAAPAAPEGSSLFDATHATGEKCSLPEGGEIVAEFAERRGDALPGLRVGGFVAGVVEPIVTALHVRALADGFRRAGRAWPVAGVDVPIDDFDDVQIEQLFAEPMLVVTPVAGRLNG